eukprot:scaffold21005_cov33-Prasinocladus_malaysianus.AAC.1
MRCVLLGMSWCGIAVIGKWPAIDTMYVGTSNTRIDMATLIDDLGTNCAQCRRADLAHKADV